MLHQTIGWLGALFFTICAVPQVIKTYQTKKSEDLSWLFLIFWLLGELLTLTYLIIDDRQKSLTHFPLYVNYIFNAVLVLYLLWAKIAYKRKPQQ